MIPLGDGAWRFDLPRGGDRAAILARLRELPRVLDAVVTDRHALVRFDPESPPEDPTAAIATAGSLPEGARRRHVIRAVYDGADLEAVARILGKTPDAVALLHASRDYEVEMLGFLPGFAYLGPLDPLLATIPRRDAPRPRVPAGAIGIAAGRTGVYPFESPGGWQLLGRAHGFSPFDPERGALLRLGDRVRFERVAAPPPASLEPPRAAAVQEAAGPALVVEHVPPGTTLQDLGRSGHMHEGVPPGGALVPELLVAANRALGNEDPASAIEIPLGPARFRAEAPVRASIDGSVVELAAGGFLDVEQRGRAVSYVAVEGGISVPLILGGRGTLLAARLGGLEGRMLRPGDRIHAGAPASRRANGESGSTAALASREPFRVVPGPDEFPPEALPVLLRSQLRISRSSDRTGTRLEGARIPWPGVDRSGSAPMVRGAIQVTLDGTPIVLGPDHPTTGGYPVIAVLVSRDLGRFASLRPGESARFVSSRA